jgi:hypothetical protein
MIYIQAASLLSVDALGAYTKILRYRRVDRATRNLAGDGPSRPLP